VKQSIINTRTSNPRSWSHGKCTPYRPVSSKWLTITLAAACGVHAQEPNPLRAEAKQAYIEVKNHIMKSAGKMPEADYGFKPAPRVRNFGQILGHIAEEQYLALPTPRQMIQMGQSRRTRLRMLWADTIHNNSHYGNLVTYMRIKGLVPPSTEGQ
jgi:hypothetical protein